MKRMFHREEGGTLVIDRHHVPRWYQFGIYRALGWRLGVALWLDDHIVKCRINRLCDWVDREGWR